MSTKEESLGPVIVITKVKIKEGKRRDYLEVAQQTSMSIKASEKGILHQTIDLDDSDPLVMVWSEVFSDEKALAAHLENPPYLLYMANHDFLGQSFQLEIYGDLSEKTLILSKSFQKTVKYFPSMYGYSRIK